MPKALNQTHQRMQAVSIRALTDDSVEVRNETLQGREYLVVPVIALVEGVVQGMNAENPELALAEEFGRVPQGWDGRPVVMNHPIINGMPVSANSPKALESYQMGFIFNTWIDGDKLKTEAWLDTARIEELGGEFSSTLERIQSGEVVEVSTGLFTSMEATVGRFNGKDYAAVWRNVVPDHLAFLSEGTLGACSIADGCGALRANEKAKLTVNTSAIKWQDCGCKHGAKTVPDNTNTNPTTNVDGTPKVTANAETQEVTVGEETIPATTEPKVHSYIPSFDVVRLAANAYPDTMLDTDARKLVDSALSAKVGEYVYILGLTKDKVVYESYDYGSGGYKYYQRSYTVNNDKTVTFDDNVERVAVTTQITPVNNEQLRSNSGESDMPDKDKPDATTPATTTESTTAETATTTQSNNSQSQPTAPAAPRTLQQYIDEAPEEIRSVLNEGIRVQKERKDGLIKTLKSTNRCKFDDAQLGAMSLETLESLVTLAAVPDFSGQNPAPREVGGQFSANAAPSMPKLIPEKAAS